jgi:hypothetical protein
METHFLLAFGEAEFLAPLAMTGSEAFFNKLLEQRASIPGGPDVYEPNVDGPNPMTIARRLRFEPILRIEVRSVHHRQFYRTGCQVLRIPIGMWKSTDS